MHLAEKMVSFYFSTLS